MVVYMVSSFFIYDGIKIDFVFLVYDVLTGAIERRLCIRNNHYGPGRDKCVRDVSWHPFENYIISTSVRFCLIRIFIIDSFYLVG